MAPAARNSGIDLLGQALCGQCAHRLSLLRDDALTREIATPAVVPTTLTSTHQLCDACLDVHRAGDAHRSRCALHAAGVVLATAGWASGISAALRDDLRRARPAGLAITAQAVAAAARFALSTGGVAGVDALITSVPTGSRHGKDPLTRLAVSVSELLAVPFVAGVFARKKRNSTRASVAQVRERIARNEYVPNATRAADLNGRAVLLLDDTVTTGHTLGALSRLLKAAGASVVLPVTLDRTVSARLLQRADARAPDRCPHVGIHQSRVAP